MKSFRLITNLGSTAVLAAAFVAANAQETALPPAPSAVLAQYGAGTAAGSGKTFHAPTTFDGPGKIPVERATTDPLRLSIDDAVSFGLTRNLRLVTDRANLKIVKGDELQVTNALVPSLSLYAATSTQEVNLAAMGFKASSLAAFGLPPDAIHTIVKVDVTQAQLKINQTLFNAPAYELLRGAKDESEVVNLNTLAGRGDLVVAVGTAYLKVLADQSALTNAQALERSAHTLFGQASEKLKAGVGASLDALRGQVEYQNREQQRISAENALAKDIIQLNRIMGLPAEQQLILTDTAPFAQLADMDLDRAKTTAFQRRKDYLSVLAQMRVADRERLAVKYQRLPTLSFGGFYGVIGETEGLYHGVFAATGSLKFPIFREAGQRGDNEVITAQLISLRQREASLRVDIEAQIRSSMFDVTSAHDLVKVAESNVDLAQQELSDERDRFNAGVDDNLPVVDAEASLAGAQAQLVQALYQYNAAKLQLARNTGIVESQYRTYLGTN
ncbi:MAG TPA: TolC family protein [Acidobacteriaceae bacterium]